MTKKLLTMYFSIFKISKYESLIGYYMIYLLANLWAILSPIDILIFYLALVVGIFIPLFFPIEGVYAPPLQFSNIAYPNAIVLENSLPIGRKNFLKGKILYSLYTGLLYAFMKIPSFITLFIISYKSSNNINIKIHLAIITSVIIGMISVNLLGALTQILSMRKISIKRTKDNKRNTWIWISVLIILNVSSRIYEFPVIDIAPRYSLGPQYIFLALGLVLILSNVVKIFWLFRNISFIDLNN